MLDYIVEASSDMQNWSSVSADVVVALQPRNLFDGTGTLEAMYRLGKPVDAQGTGFLRVRAKARGQGW